MAACSKCGSVIAENAVFCSVCGSPVSSAGRPAVPPPPPPPLAGAASTGMTSNIAGALCYLLTFITGILFLVLEPYKRDRFVRFHAFQSIFFGVILVVFNSCFVEVHTAFHQSSGFCSTQLGCGYSVLYVDNELARTFPCSSNSEALFPVVPRSWASMNFSAILLLF